jgi:Zn-finger nucleic acid-binding protein
VLRRLLACPHCRRQYDVGGAGRGETLRCLCGELLRVAEPRVAEVPVVRCAACGGPREPGAARCGYCRAPFAAAERDRNTICPQCAARIADAARFCSSCGTRIDPQPIALVATSAACPACVPPRPLHSRAFPEPPANVLECPACGGLWLSRELWSALELRARREATPAVVPRGAANVAAGPVVYRDCPICADKMHRRNYGGRSGVIVDLCGRHGLWFDAEELARALDWIRGGGHEVAEQLRRDEERVRQREKRLRPVEPFEPPPNETEPWSWPLDVTDLLALLATLFRRVSRPG